MEGRTENLIRQKEGERMRHHSTEPGLSASSHNKRKTVSQLCESGGRHCFEVLAKHRRRLAMEQQRRSLYCHLLTVILVLVLGLQCRSFAQQLPNGETYFCSDSGATQCDAFALYRAEPNYATFPAIAALFNIHATDLTSLNNGVPVNQKFNFGDPVLVPLTCICFNQTSYANLTHTIQSGDTFYNLNVENFESLSTTTAVINANPTLDYNNLQIGTPMVFPVRCGCPSLDQISGGVKSLVTYPVITGDATSQIAASFGVPTQSVIDANELVGGYSQIQAQTTLLIPINNARPNYSAVVFPSTPSSAPSSGPVVPSSHHCSSNIGVSLAIGVGAGTLIFLGVCAAVCCLWTIKRRTHRKNDTESPLVRGKSVGEGKVVPTSASLSDSSTKKPLVGDPLARMSDYVGSDRPTLFTYEELCDATNNFSDGSVLQGSVYRGILKGQLVAIKQTNGNVSQELRILCRVHHSNLIKLVGLCVNEHLYLVYEYAENGSLSDCLHTDFLSKTKLSTKSSSFLSWTTRVQIALDVASGLEYIHDCVAPSYVHKNVKSSNILLDGAFRAKISNFAMAKSTGANTDMMTRHIGGTYGYMAPEYLQHGLVTTKADVFSFGVVLLELLSGDEATSGGAGGEERCLYSAIRPTLESPDPVTSLKRWIDPVLSNNYPMDTAMSIARLAKRCVDSDPLLRPSIKDVTFALSKDLNASLEWETSAVFASALAETPIEAR